MNRQKTVSVLHILQTLFWHYIDILPDYTYLDAGLITFPYSCFLVDPLGNEEVFISIFLSVGYMSAMNDVVPAQLNVVSDLIEGLALLAIDLYILTKLLAEGV